MKQLGMTPQGGAIVELSPAEQKVLHDALSALDGCSFAVTFPYHGLRETELSPLFVIIDEWTQARFAINRARQILDNLQNALNGKTGDER